MGLGLGLEVGLGLGLDYFLQYINLVFLSQDLVLKNSLTLYKKGPNHALDQDLGHLFQQEGQEVLREDL